MADIAYSLETLIGKNGGLLEVVEAIVWHGRLAMILTDEDAVQRRDAPRPLRQVDSRIDFRTKKSELQHSEFYKKETVRLWSPVSLRVRSLVCQSSSSQAVAGFRKRLFTRERRHGDDRLPTVFLRLRLVL